jgi:hypothetical protein
MDIVKEFKNVSLNKTDFNTIMHIMEQEKEEMHKKLHLIRVLALLDSIDEKIRIGYFKEKNVSSLHISKGVYGIVSHAFYGKGGDYADDQELDGLGTIFKNINEFKTRYVNKSLDPNSNENNGYKIKLNKNCREKLLDALLSEELKKILEYSQLYSEMNNINANQLRKPKV